MICVDALQNVMGASSFEVVEGDPIITSRSSIVCMIMWPPVGTNERRLSLCFGDDVDQVHGG